MTRHPLPLVALCLLSSVLASCAPVGDDQGALPEGSESVQVALTAVPTGMRCVRFTTTAGGRTFAQDFDVTGLPNLTAQVRGLPANVALSMSADAYAVACASITPTTQAVWASAPVAVTLTPGVVPAVSFVLRPAGGVNGDVDFLFLAATPASRAFATTVVGQTSAATAFTVTNIGSAATGALAASLTGTGANQFAIGTNTCTAALAVNATCSIQVTFKPTTAGAKAATLQVAGTPGGTLPIALSGTGAQAAVLALAPATQDFGTVAVAKSSPLVTYTVTNSGGPTTAPVVVTSSDPAFAVSASTCTDVLAQGATCTVKVAFAPTAIAAKAATLTATAGTVTADATVTGTGAAAPALTITPSVLNFGTVIAGNSAQMPVTVKNVGGFPLSAFSVFVGGTSSDAFVVDGTGCVAPGTLAPGATCMFFVNVVAPDPGSATRPYSSTLLVTAGGANPASVMGTASTTISWPFVPNPTSFFFSGVKAGTTSSVNITFTNVSGASLPPINFATTGPVFTIASSTCGNGFGVAAGGVCTVVVRYNAPATAGVMSVDVLSVKPIPGVGPNGVTVALRGTSAP